MAIGHTRSEITFPKVSEEVGGKSRIVPVSSPQPPCQWLRHSLRSSPRGSGSIIKNSLSPLKLQVGLMSAFFFYKKKEARERKWRLSPSYICAETEQRLRQSISVATALGLFSVTFKGRRCTQQRCWAPPDTAKILPNEKCQEVSSERSLPAL